MDKRLFEMICLIKLFSAEDEVASKVVFAHFRIFRKFFRRALEKDSTFEK